MSESIDKHDTEPCKVNTRVVEAIVEELNRFLDHASLRFDSAHLSIALLTEAHRLASNGHMADDLLYRHEGLMIDTGDGFDCRRCGEFKLAKEGAADVDPETCDDCIDIENSDAVAFPGDPDDAKDAAQ